MPYQTRSLPKWTLALTSLGFFMAMMDSMIVTTASTAIRRDFGIEVGQLQWTLNAYNITIAAVLLIGVAIGDRIGHRRLYVIGLSLFVIGSGLCALSGGIGMLIAARVLQGIGASVMTPMSMALLTAAVPPRQRGKALGIWSGVGGLALIVGPALGGLISAYFTWQWIFWINVPVGVVVAVLSWRKLDESTSRSSEIRPQKISVLDSALVIVASAGLIWSLSQFSATGGVVSAVMGTIVSLVIAAIFVVRQRGAESSMAPLRLFASRTFGGGVVATFLLYASMYAVVFFLPQYFQIVGGANALVSGLELLPWTATLVVVGPFAGAAADRFGERGVGVLGLLLQAVGYAWIGIDVSRGDRGFSAVMIVALVVAGAGVSMAGPALQKAVLGSAGAEFVGKASGIYNMFRQLGGAVGTALSVIVFAGVGATMSDSLGFVHGFVAVMIEAGIVSAVGAACAWSREK